MKNLSTDFNTIYLNIHLRNQEKVPKTHDQQHIASLHAGVGGAVSNDDYAFAPEVSESEDLAYASAGIISLDVGGNRWRQDDDLNSDDPRGFRALTIRDPIFTFPSSFRT